jgi:hypothetical protein
VLIFVACLSASFYLLEHATWSYIGTRHDKDIDIGCLRRWTMEGDLPHAYREVQDILCNIESRNAAAMDHQIVYGTLRSRDKAML